jgi:hypothetical protein
VGSRASGSTLINLQVSIELTIIDG